ncbi:MAG: porin family protein [Gammaproteobacteria bacterium]|nr:porin family protein [Gammaproteobacteria bacterium]
MKKMTALALALTSSLAMADSHFAINYAMIDYSEVEGPDVKPSALVVSYGSEVNEYFDFQGRLGLGLASDDISINNFNVDISVKNFIGAYIIAKVPTDSDLQPYGVLGFTRGKLEADIQGAGKVSESESDLSYGFGVDYAIDTSSALNFEYTVYLDKNGFEVNSIALGYKGFF